MLEISAHNISLAPELEHKSHVMSLVIGRISLEDVALKNIPVKDCDSGDIELFLNGKRFARGELTMDKKTGSVKILELF